MTDTTNSPQRQKRSKRLIFWLATRLGWLVLLAIGHLTRIRYRGREHFDHLRDSRRPFLMSVWHGKILIPIFLHRHEGIHGMVSEHSDGEMIAQTLHRLGYRTVRGSSTRGGRRAMIGMIRALQEGNAGAIMPDGPRGPRHVCKPGAIAIAERAHAAILPLTFASSKCWRLRSWDRFTIPVPFSRTVMLYGAPIEVPPLPDEQALEEMRKYVESKLLELEAEAETIFPARPPGKPATKTSATRARE